MIKVIHKKNRDKYSDVIYVGRGSALGNPFTSIQGRETMAETVVDSRKESIDRYYEHLCVEIAGKNEKICKALNEIYLKALNGDVQLACYCSPKPCHADIIKEIVESKLPEGENYTIKTALQLEIFEDISKDSGPSECE